jgi:hypothetical protein
MSKDSHKHEITHSNKKRNFRCDGCKNNIYSAPGGCVGKPYPHSLCKVLGDIEMIVDKGSWAGSLPPQDCPTIMQLKKS